MKFIGIEEITNSILSYVELKDTNLKFDTRNYAMLKSVKYTELNGGATLSFFLIGSLYSVIDILEPEQNFEFKFRGVELIESIPKEFISFTGSLKVDDVWILEDNGIERARVRWDGDTETAEPDPSIEFFRDSVEVIVLPD